MGFATLRTHTTSRTSTEHYYHRENKTTHDTSPRNHEHNSHRSKANGEDQPAQQKQAHRARHCSRPKSATADAAGGRRGTRAPLPPVPRHTCTTSASVAYRKWFSCSKDLPSAPAPLVTALAQQRQLSAQQQKGTRLSWGQWCAGQGERGCNAGRASYRAQSSCAARSPRGQTTSKGERRLRPPLSRSASCKQSLEMQLWTSALQPRSLAALSDRVPNELQLVYKRVLARTRR